MTNANKDLVILDARFSLMAPAQGQQEYDREHIAEARYAHLDNDLAGPVTPTSGRHPLPAVEDWVATLQNWGVNSNSQVVIYDHGNSAIAARLWWMLGWLGHTAVAVLDGGLQAWKQQGNALSSEYPRQRQGSINVGLGDNNRWISSESLATKLAEVRLFDARAQQRYAGEKEPIDSVAGHVPGAVCLPFEGNLTEHNLFKSPEQLQQRFAPLIPEDGSPLVHMCGSGVTACHNILAMTIAGYPDTKLYVGSWSEWIRSADRPIAVGDQP